MPILGGGGARGRGGDSSNGGGGARGDCSNGLGGGARGRGDCDTERSSISTSSSATSSNLSSGHWTQTSAVKLSKFGKRIRESCRNLKAKPAKTSSSHNPEDYTSFQLPNESVRSKVYVAMDFSGEEGGRVLENPRDIQTCDKAGPASKDGYVPFRRRVAAPVADRLTETQANIHKSQPWFHPNLPRERANKILQAHANTDGVFLVRESSVSGGYVISYTSGGKQIHSQVLPVPTGEGVVYSVDEGRTKFYDLLQLVEFYQLNAGSLPTRLIHYLVSSREKKEVEEVEEKTKKDGEVHTMVVVCGNSEVDSAMSQDGGSDEENANREQQG